MMKKISCLLFLLCLGCAKHADRSSFTAGVINKNSLQFKGINADLLANLRTDTLSQAEWQTLLPVYRMPADTDMKDFQNNQPGKYKLTDSSVIFMADTPFQKNQTYFARFYQYHDNSSKWDIFKHGWKSHKAQYTEVVFKP